ncbi:MAG: hypothetical protein ACF8NJ_10970 [Phycisphaerales bacterium JB038]
MSTITSDILTSDFSLQASPLLEDPASAAFSGTEAAADTFAQVLDRLGGAEARDEEALAARAREAAEEFVAIAMVQPILAQLREHPLVDAEEMGPLAPSRSEKMLQPLWDAQAAQRIVQAADWPMVERLGQQLLQKAGALRATPGTEVDRHA